MLISQRIVQLLKLSHAILNVSSSLILKTILLSDNRTQWTRRTSQTMNRFPRDRLLAVNCWAQVSTTAGERVIQE